MHTIRTTRAETRSISIAAAPTEVFGLLADPRRLPEWAPAFAQSVTPMGGEWLVDSGAGELVINVRSSPQHGTVDLLAHTSPDRGAFMRVLPNHEGSEFMFTLFFPNGTDEEAVSLQMTTVETELETVRALCESPLPLAAGGAAG